MPNTAKRIVLVVAAFIVVVFAIFLFNQTVQIVQSARAVNSIFGNGVMGGSHFHLLHTAHDSIRALVPVAETDAAARNDRRCCLRPISYRFQETAVAPSPPSWTRSEFHHGHRNSPSETRSARRPCSHIYCVSGIPQHCGIAKRSIGCSGGVCRSNTTHLANCPRVLPKTVASGLCAAICERGFDSFYRCWH